MGRLKFATVELNGEQLLVVEEEGSKKLIKLTEAANQLFGNEVRFPATMLELISGGDEEVAKVEKILIWAKQQSKEASFYIEPEAVEWMAPIPKPTKNIFCVGKNYAEHAIEMGSKDDIPEHVMLFTKAPTTVIAHGEAIPSHENVTKQLDYEGELAVVISKKAKGIGREEANEYIFGYTIINDVTARDLQSRHKQFFIGKSLDGTCPMGPYIVHHSAIQTPVKLNVQTKVNGEIRQNGNTKQFIFSIPEILEVLTKGMTLEAGDIIATGTPAGVGKGFNPPIFLKSGDEITIEIEQVGVLKNKVE